MTFSEPQTPLFPPYVNLMIKNDQWKTGESEHNTGIIKWTSVDNSENGRSWEYM